MALENSTLLTRYAAEHYERNSISAGRRSESDAVLRKLAARLDSRSLIELTPSDLMEWQGAELKRGLTPTTVRKNQNMIRAFIGWAYHAQLIPFELTAQLKSVNGVRGATAKARPKPYKRSELQLFRERLSARYPLLPVRGRGSRGLRRYLEGGPFTAHIKRHARRLTFEAKVSLALEEGLRCVEIHNLTINDMHHENESVVVRTAKGEPGHQRVREVPFTAHSRLCVQEWIEFHELLVPGHPRAWLTLWWDDPRHPETYRHHLKSLEKIEGHWNWHRFRHTFATERLRGGMPLEQLQVMMGHARLEQTLAYAEIVNADVRVEAARTSSAFARNIGLEEAS